MKLSLMMARKGVDDRAPGSSPEASSKWTEELFRPPHCEVDSEIGVIWSPVALWDCPHRINQYGRQDPLYQFH